MNSIIKLLGRQRNRMDDRNVPTTLARAAFDASICQCDLSRAEGNHQYLVGRLQERYGWQKDPAEREIRDFERTLQNKPPRNPQMR